MKHVGHDRIQVAKKKILVSRNFKSNDPALFEKAN